MCLGDLVTSQRHNLPTPALRTLDNVERNRSRSRSCSRSRSRSLEREVEREIERAQRDAELHPDQKER